MNEVSLNIEAIRQKARADWRTRQRAQRTFQDRIEASVPNWLIIVAGALFALSAPHTAKMFDLVTPGFGFAGVLAVEFGLLYIAFRRKLERKRNGLIPVFLRAFEVLLFLTSILVNGAGALIAVATATGVSGLSAGTILSSFENMSIVAQVGLLLVPLAALIIPIGTVVAGEGLASHSIDTRAESSALDLEWQGVEQLEVYRAAYSYLLRNNVNSRDAQRRAGSAVTNLFNRPLPLPADILYVEGELTAHHALDAPSAPVRRTVFRRASRSAVPARRQDARLAVREYLEAHPDATGLSVRQLAAEAGISKTIAGEELSKWKAQHGKG